MRRGFIAVVGSLSMIVLAGCQGTLRGTLQGTPAQSADTSIQVPHAKLRSGSVNWVIKDYQLAGPADLAGYTDHVSVRSGEPFKLYVSSSDGSFSVHAFRLGWYGGTGARRVWTSPVVPGVKQGRADAQPPPHGDDELAAVAHGPDHRLGAGRVPAVAACRERQGEVRADGGAFGLGT
ncbi:hypothetical protein JOF29_007746 [Kribbella aluminosa]|uniref:Uncharacterized protein n=1 Tax=Kribbella aluminosa TaxID=416017 RepID=A0ABS4UYL9_9ACTN|nr:hypothetical protein [Kribbella aluminosa]MBP2356636.1 hypothetical protein [Kribbella aluminosa]